MLIISLEALEVLVNMKTNPEERRFVISKKWKWAYAAVISIMVCLCVINYTHSVKSRKAREVTNLVKEQSISSDSELPGDSLKSPLTEDTNQNFINDYLESIHEEPKNDLCNSDSSDLCNSINAKIVNYKFSDIIKPLDGKITNEFSDDELTYCKTMEDFRIHDAIDIEAEVGSNVKSVCDGVVEEIIINDEMYGTCILIKHNNDFSTRYCGLQEVVLVKEGDTVTKGQTIGGVGNSGICEVSEPPHLHFQIIKNNQTVNPSKFF